VDGIGYMDEVPIDRDYWVGTAFGAAGVDEETALTAAQAC
jgi:hypothetical protein